MGGGYSTSTTTVNNLASWSGTGIQGYGRYQNFTVDPQMYAMEYLGRAYFDMLKPVAGDPNFTSVDPDYIGADGLLHGQKVYKIPAPTIYDPDGTPHIPPPIYPKTYAVLERNEESALRGMAYRGRTGDNLVTEAIAYVAKVLSGDFQYKSTYPYLNNMIEDLKTKLQDAGQSISSQSSTRTLLSQNAPGTVNIFDFVTAQFQTRMTELDARIVYENFDMYRNIQDDVLDHVIDLGKQSVLDAELLRMAGLYDREWRQGDIENRYKFWRDDYTGWVKRIETCGNAIRALVGTQETETRRFYKPSPILGIVGGVATAAVGFATGNPVAGVSGLLGAIGSATG